MYEHDTSTGMKGLAEDFDERMEHIGQTLLLTANGQEEEDPVWGAMEHWLSLAAVTPHWGAHSRRRAAGYDCG
jgi:hypothetical protein